jgi:hypothetical protein
LIRDGSYKKLIACDDHSHGSDVERKNCKSRERCGVKRIRSSWLKPGFGT